ncbi:LysR substrate-binding domain-containing protein [Arsenicicoccus sp. oral taxon 190]|uniref:LysR substrate-binding domain-containing protein n=1 Tax=Arsenicicoccus sp. oral taxon 190 TaxID=1658671 RepID=UPI00067A1C0A|nr:LysR substrate-binding domain-containing protein [Arsenicicoccus sp. oral taxon 190]AKT51995.1 transcriptional regulator [Arsenicicoccus sp. oral taxon 190]
MNLRDLEYLVALADERHFGRAAAASYVSQPTLSTQVKKLESELGVDLIERGSRQVLLTDAGEQVVRRARSILAQAQDIRDLARSARDPRAGRLRLGMFPTLGPYLLPHVVPELRRRFPELELLLTEAKTSELLSQLHAGALDVALVALPVPDESLHAQPLFREDFLLAVPSEHPLAAAAEQVTPGSLAGEDLLLLAEGHCLRDQALEVCQTTGAAEQAGFRATSLETLRHMVAAGVGSTLLPRLAVSPPASSTDGIVLREFAGQPPHRDIAAVWRRSSVQGPLLAEIAAVLADLPTGLVTPVPR